MIISAFLVAMAAATASHGDSKSAQSTTTQATWHAASSHHIEFVTIEKNVRLEVIDWGGAGRPVVLLAGLGNTAHVFDDFAPRLATSFHVYGITRRGFGASSVPQTGYSADRLGDDVLAVLDHLKIERPILVGHSIAGEELSSIATRHPERISGLIYLEAANEYAFYDQEHGAYTLDLASLFGQIKKMQDDDPLDPKAMLTLQADMSTLNRSLGDTLALIESDGRSPSGPPSKADLASFPAMQTFIARQICARIPVSELRQTFVTTSSGEVGAQRAPSFVYQEILNGEQKYEGSKVPMLAIVAVPKTRCGPVSGDPTKLRAAEAREVEMINRQYAAVQKLVPSAEFVRIAGASHHVFLSNEADVLKSITSFANSLQ